MEPIQWQKAKKSSTADNIGTRSAPLRRRIERLAELKNSTLSQITRLAIARGLPELEAAAGIPEDPHAEQEPQLQQV